MPNRSSAVEELATTAVSLAESVQDINGTAIDMGTDIGLISDGALQLNSHTEKCGEQANRLKYPWIRYLKVPSSRQIILTGLPDRLGIPAMPFQRLQMP